jgi:hypothetical protein
VTAAAVLVPGAHTRPSAHAPVTIERPVVSQYEPAVHGVGAEAAATQNDPAAHACCVAALDAAGQ